MRFNDKELVKVGESEPALEGVLHHLKPQGTDWSDWYLQPQWKERNFKLVANLLYYYRVNEPEPLGVLVLENAQVAYEQLHKGIHFAFSITFKVNDKFRDNEAKHIFSCRCEEDVNRWVSALRMHSYEYWRGQYIILQTKISMKTGQEPVLDYMDKAPVKAKRAVKQTRKVTAGSSSTFCSHVDTSFFQSHTETKVMQSSEVTVENLIDL